MIQRPGVKKLNLKNLPLETSNVDESGEDLGRITERSKESTEFDRLNTDRSARKRTFEKSMNKFKQSRVLQGLSPNTSYGGLQGGILELNATLGDSKDDVLFLKKSKMAKNRKNIEKIFNQHTNDSQDFKENKMMANTSVNGIKFHNHIGEDCSVDLKNFESNELQAKFDNHDQF